MKYYISVIDINKQDVKIEVFSIETISFDIESVNLTEVKKMFTSKEASGVNVQNLDLLIHS